MASRRYVYAILAPGARLPTGLTGLGGAPLLPVVCRDLVALTSSIDPAAPQPTAELVLEHERIVEAVRQSEPCLPVRFGTVLASADAVAQALAARYDVLADDLARLGSAVELGLLVLWRRDDARGEDQLAELVSPARGTDGPGGRYLLARLVEQRREDARRDEARSLGQIVDEALGRHAAEQRCSILPAPRLPLRAAYLLDPSSLEPFRRAFEQVRRGHPDLRFLLSGPWPPYSFVTPSEAGGRSDSWLGDLLGRGSVAGLGLQ